MGSIEAMLTIIDKVDAYPRETLHVTLEIAFQELDSQLVKPTTGKGVLGNGPKLLPRIVTACVPALNWLDSKPTETLDGR